MLEYKNIQTDKLTLKISKLKEVHLYPPKKVSKPSSEIELTSDYKPTTAINWYPGHMARAIREIKEKLKLVDIVLEVRDARAPLASGNFLLEETLRQKSHYILLNKSNLADPSSIAKWDKWFSKQSFSYVFFDCFDRAAIKKILAHSRKIVEEKRRASTPENYQPRTKLKLMIIGLPNTGKSTIINQLANRSATKTADRPGQTQVQQWIVIDETLDLLDTPGVMPPSLSDDQHGLWLSAIHAIPDDIVGEELPANFLVKYFREKESKEFLTRYKLGSFELSNEETIEKIAAARGCLKKGGAIDYDRVYKLILGDFRKGDLGKSCFELPPIESTES